MKSEKQIEKKMKQLLRKADLGYCKETGSRMKNNYAYGQYLILKWIMGDSSIK